LIRARPEKGQPQPTSQLLPLGYDELRQLAAQKLAQEKPGQTRKRRRWSMLVQA
jgi:hypothetical protein